MKPSWPWTTASTEFCGRPCSVSQTSWTYCVIALRESRASALEVHRPVTRTADTARLTNLNTTSTSLFGLLTGRADTAAAAWCRTVHATNEPVRVVANHQ